MISPELAAVHAIQAILDGLPSQSSRRFVVKMVAEHEQIRECQVVKFGDQPNQTIAR